MGNNKIIYCGNLSVKYSMPDFIAAVRDFAILWDRKHPDFHMREKRDMAWQDVCGKVCTHYSEITKEEQEKIVEILVKRWKNTRDCYLRSLRLRNDAGYCIRRYIYEDELSFLASQKSLSTKKSLVKSNKKRRRSSEDSSPRSLRGDDTKKKFRDTSNNGQHDFDSEFDNISMDVGDIVKDLSDNVSADPLVINSETKKESPQKDNTIEVDEATGPETKCDRNAVAEPQLTNNNKFFIEEITDVDADQAFFDSIKPMMKNLSPDKKLDFQIEVLILLKHFRNKP